MKNILIILSFALSFTSCIDVNNVINPGDKPIVEAYLAPNHTVSMKVFTEIPYSETDSTFSVPISGLSITIKNLSGASFTLTESETKGTYVSTAKLGDAGQTYSMSFIHNGRTVSATTILPVKPVGFQMSVSEIERIYRDLSSGFQGGGGGGPGGPPQGGGFQQEAQTNITLTWTNPDEIYHFVAAQYLETTLSPIVQFPTNETGFTRPARRFTNRPIKTNTSSVQSQQFEYFGRYAIILYRLNPDYAALYENDNTSSQNLVTPVSTIENGLGIFTGVNADTLILNVKKQVL